MRRLRTLRLIISIVLSLSTFYGMAQRADAGSSPHPSPAKRVMADTIKAPKHNHPLYCGMMVGVNIADPILRLFGQDYGGYEGFLEVNLRSDKPRVGQE